MKCSNCNSCLNEVNMSIYKHIVTDKLIMNLDKKEVVDCANSDIKPSTRVHVFTCSKCGQEVSNEQHDEIKKIAYGSN